MAITVNGAHRGSLLFDFSSMDGYGSLAEGLEGRISWEITNQDWENQTTTFHFIYEGRLNSEATSTTGYTVPYGAGVTFTCNENYGLYTADEYVWETTAAVKLTTEWKTIHEADMTVKGVSYSSAYSQYNSISMTLSAMMHISMKFEKYDTIFARGLSPIPYIWSTSQDTYNDAQNPTFTMMYPTLNHFTPDDYPTGVRYIFGDMRYLTKSADIDTSILTVGLNEYTFELTDEERVAIQQSMGSATSKSYQFLVYTELDAPREETYTLKKVVKMELTDSEPVINPEVKDVNEVTVALTGDASVLVRYASNAQATINAEAVKEATISTIEIKNGDNLIATDVNTVIYEGVESNKFTFTAINNRNEITKQVLEPTFIEYIPVTCAIATDSATGSGELRVIARGNYWTGDFGAVENTPKAYYRFMKSTDEAYCDWIAFSAVETDAEAQTYEASEYVTGLDYQSSYVFQCYMTDAVGDITYSAEQRISVTPIFDWGQHDFNFNVPVTIQGSKVVTEDEVTSVEEINTMFDEFRVEMDGVVEEATNRASVATDILAYHEDLTVSVAPDTASKMGTYTFTAELIGTNLYIHFYNKCSINLNSSAPIVLGTVTIAHGGKIAYMPSEFYAVTDCACIIKFHDVSYTDNSVSFTITFADGICSGNQFTTAISVPVAVNKDAY